MQPHEQEPSVKLAGVQVIRDTGHTWLMRIDGRQVAIPPRLVLPGSTVAWPRARYGTIVIPKSLATSLGVG